MENPFQGQQLPPPSETRGPMLLQAMWIQFGIATPVLIARVCARMKHVGRLGWDDYLMILSLISALVTAGLVTEAVHWGFGRHIYYLTPEQITNALRMSYLTVPFAFMALVFGRVSFAVSLVVLMGINKWRRWLLCFCIVGQFVANILVIGLILGACTPAEKYWNPATPGRCLGMKARTYPGYALSAFNIFTDLVLAVMPAWVISSLNLKKRVKIGLMILMGLGVFNMAAAVVTLVELTRMGKIMDITYVHVVSDIWGLVQTYLVIVIASIPFLKPLFVGSKIFSWSYYRSLIVRYSQRSRSTSGRDGRNSDASDDTLYREKVNVKTLESLPHVDKDRFVTTTLRNVGMESSYDRLSYAEEGVATLKR